jgi:hypothetical protein
MLQRTVRAIRGAWSSVPIAVAKEEAALVGDISHPLSTLYSLLSTLYREDELYDGVFSRIFLGSGTKIAS